MSRPLDDLLLTLDSHGKPGHVQVRLSRRNGVLLAEDEAPAVADPWRLSRLLTGFPETDVPGADLACLGRMLAEIALPPNVRVGLREILAADPISAVRVRLNADTDLAALPWEYLHLGEAERDTDLSGYLGLHLRLRLVRAPSPEGIAHGLESPEMPAIARVLLVHADPGAPGCPRLPQVAAEMRAVQCAFETPECRRAEVRTLMDTTPAALQRALCEYAPHVLHLIGHGDIRPSGGVLVLQGEREGTAACVYADTLAEWAASAPLRLAVLSVCHGGVGEGGLARALAAKGVPAAIGMQLRLRDAGAGLFSRAFYAALLESCPADEAMAQARQALRGFGIDWGVPLLFLSGPGGPLFASAGPQQRRSSVALPPTNVPHRPSEAFVGRDGILSELHRVLTGGRSAALVGMGGLGKTQTAAEYAHAHRSEYPGGVFWVAAGDTRRLTDDLAALGRQHLGAPHDWHVGDAAAWARDMLARSAEPVLLICDDVGAGLELGLLPPTGACRLLLTTREGYRVPPGVRAFFLPSLDDQAARTLLGADDAPPAEQEAADAIAALLGGLPLALALVAHHVERLDQTFAGYQARLESAPFETLRLAARRFKAATGHDGALYDALALSWGSLTPEAAGILEAAALLGRAPIPPDLLLETWGVGTREDFDEAVADLVDGAMLQRGAGALSLHSLVRAFAWAQANEGERRGEERVARVAETLARRLSQALEGGQLNPARAEAPHADAIAARCRDLNLSHPLALLVGPLGMLACQEGRFAWARALYDEGLARLETLEDSADIARSADYRHERAEAQFRMEEPAAALVDARAALRLARRAYGRRASPLAKFYLQVGLYLRHRKQFGRARSFYNRALQMAETEYGPGHPLVAECLNNLGTMLEFQGDLAGALTFLTDAEAVYGTALGSDAPKRGVILNNLGRVWTKQGRYELALASHTEALAIHESAYGRRHPWIATGLFHSAEAAEGLGRIAEAQAYFTEALALYEHFYGTTNYRCAIVRASLTQ